jgi:hypothetical protein
VKTQALTGRLAPFRFMQSPSLNGIAFTTQPEAPARTEAVALGWTVNKSPQDAMKSTACLTKESSGRPLCTRNSRYFLALCVNSRGLLMQLREPLTSLQFPHI